MKSNNMMTSSNENIFRVTGPLCGEFTGPGEFPTQRPVTQSFGVFFDLRLNKRLSKQPWGWWFETPSWSLWRHRNGKKTYRWLSPRLWSLQCVSNRVAHIFAHDTTTVWLLFIWIHDIYISWSWMWFISTYIWYGWLTGTVTIVRHRCRYLIE